MNRSVIKSDIHLFYIDTVNSQKLMVEYEKFQEMQAKSQRMQEEYERQLQEMQETNEKKIQDVTEHFESKLSEKVLQLEQVWTVWILLLLLR